MKQHNLSYLYNSGLIYFQYPVCNHVFLNFPYSVLITPISFKTKLWDITVGREKQLYKRIYFEIPGAQKLHSLSM